MIHARINTSALYHPRNGAEKKLTVAQPVIGHRSRIQKSHEFKHGSPIGGSNPPLSREQPIPVHPHMTPAQKAKHEATAGNASGVFADAVKLGKE
jgi:hypothetical protein